MNHKYAILTTASLTALLLAACADTNADDGGAGGAGGAGGEPWVAPFDPTVCGMQAYTWLDPSTTGVLIEYEELALYHWPKSMVDFAIEEAGYQGAAIAAKYGAVVYRFRYETQDRGERVEATGIVAFPEDEDLDEPIEAPWILWLHGTTGFMDDCAPSDDERSDGPLSALIMASQGFVTVAPDYIGMNGMGAPSTTFHPYLVAEPTAIAAWDAMTAVQAIESELVEANDLQAVTDDRVIIWGASQGGHATLVTELYAPYYAPRWDLVAAVAMIPAVDLVAQSVVAMQTWTDATALIAAMVVEQGRWYGMEDRLDEVLNDEAPNPIATALPAELDGGCSIDIDAYGITGPEDIYRAEFVTAVADADWAGYEDWKCLLSENSLNTTSVPRISDTPFYFIVSEQDELLNSPAQRVSYDALCDLGWEMNYIECLGAGHAAGAFWSLLEQLTWVEARLAGEPLTDACVRPAPVCCLGTDDGSCVP